MNIDPATVKYGDVFRAGAIVGYDLLVMFVCWDTESGGGHWTGTIVKDPKNMYSDRWEALTSKQPFDKYPWEPVE